GIRGRRVAERIAVGPRHDIADPHGERRRREGRVLDRHRARRGQRDQWQRKQYARDDNGRGPRDRGAPHGHTLRHVPPQTARVTLVESMGKKARFLEEVTSTLAIDGVEIRNERAEVLAHARRERYDVGTARAVGTLGAVVEYLLPFLRVGGDAIAWKGRLDAE